MTRIGTRIDGTTLMVMGAGAASMALGVALSGWPEARLAAPPPRAVSNAPAPAQIRIPDSNERLAELEAAVARLERDRLAALARGRLLQEQAHQEAYADLLIDPRATNTGSMLLGPWGDGLTMDDHAMLDALGPSPRPPSRVLTGHELGGADMRYVIRGYQCGVGGVLAHDIISSRGYVMLAPMTGDPDHAVGPGGSAGR